MLLNRQMNEKPLELKFGCKTMSTIWDKVLHQSSAVGFKVWCKTLLLLKDKVAHCNAVFNGGWCVCGRHIAMFVVTWLLGNCASLQRNKVDTWYLSHVPLKTGNTLNRLWTLSSSPLGSCPNPKYNTIGWFLLTGSLVHSCTSCQSLD